MKLLQGTPGTLTTHLPRWLSLIQRRLHSPMVQQAYYISLVCQPRLDSYRTQSGWRVPRLHAAFQSSNEPSPPAASPDSSPSSTTFSKAVSGIVKTVVLIGLGGTYDACRGATGTNATHPRSAVACISAGQRQQWIKFVGRR